MGRRDQAGKDALRDGGRTGEHGSRSHAAGGPQTPTENEICFEGKQGIEMKARELRDLTEEELKSKEEETKDQLFKLKFQHALGQLENAMKLQNLKKDIARIKTIIRESK